MHKRIVITTSFISFHRWLGAPEPFAYLRHIHRHRFEVRVEVIVNDSNREVEFIDFKKTVDQIIKLASVEDYKFEYETSEFTPAPLEWSCEHWCEYILNKMHEAVRVDVYEDGENGAYITRQRAY